MARTPRYGGPYTPQRGLFAGIQFPSYFQYRTFQSRLRGAESYGAERRQRREAAGKPPERAAPRSRWHQEGPDAAGFFWHQYGREGGPALRGRPALAALASEVQRRYGADAGIVVSWYANGETAVGSDFVNVFDWKSIKMNSTTVQAICNRLLKEGETGVEGPASFVRTVTEGTQRPTEVQAIQIRRARG